MLSTEEAKTRLDSLRDPRWRTRALARVGKLRRRLREPALTFLQSPQAGQGAAAFEHHRQRRVAAARKFDELPDGQRVSVMEALHPGLGAALARWWVDAQGRPYQRGWDRRAFRTADSPGLTVEARGLDLAVLIALAGPFEADPVWLAGWGGHLATGKGPMAQVSLAIGGVLASAIDLGGRVGEETLAALMAVGSGEHPAGVMGRHVIVGLLGCSRQEGWDYIGRLLLAAQRQEGLRQAILEAADEGHPAAFDHILGLVLDHRLLRFAAAVRAAGVWLGFGAFVADIPQVEARVRKLAAFRADAAGRSRALAGDDPWDAYLALCARGMHDVLATIPEAKALSHHASPDVRAAALRYAAATGLLTGQHMLVAALDDPDIRVASLAAVLLAPAGLALDGVFDALTRLIPRLPAKTKTAAGALGVEAAPARLSSARAAGLLVGARGQRPAGALVPWLPRMCVSDRARAAMQIADEPVVTAGFRPVLVGLLSDRSAHVRRQALRGLSGTRLASSEAPAVEALLTRTATDVRRAALTLLASLPPEAARASASRLAASSNAGQRRAAAELPGVLEDAAHENVPDTLPDPQARTRPLVPRATRGRGNFGGGVARRIVEALDAIAHEHRNTPVLATWWQGSREFLFGDIRWFPMPAAAARPGVPPAGSQDDGRGMVLGEVFRDWWDRRPDELRDEDGLDALRAYAMAQVTSPESPFIPGNGEWCRSGLRELTGPAPRNLRHPAAVRHVVSWLAVENASAMVIGECLDALEASLARIPRSALTAPASNTITMGGHVMTTYRGPHSIPGNDWRHHLTCNPWLTLLRGLLRTKPGLFSPAQITRWYRLMRWVEQPRPDAVALPVDEALLIAAHDIAAASEADVVAAFLQPRNMLFRELTRRWRGRMQARHPGLTVIADKVRDHLIRTELDRGDLPTPTSPAVLNIRSTCGAALAVEILRLVGQAPLVRGHALDSDSRDVVFSHLLRVSFPAPADAPTALAAAVKEAGLPGTRLVDLAVYAPQWAPLAEQALGWPGLADGVLWLHAHTRDLNWRVDQELRDSWAAMTAERTTVSADDLLSGAVDVSWFRAAHAALGSDRWAILDKAAKYASGGTGHGRARLFAQAMLGQFDEATLTGRITAKRNQDAVRALGLLPLPAAKTRRERAVQRRYATLREFERTSRSFGSQRQASERAAVRIAVENLARTAGYADPRRFTWAVEAREAGDLADGPVTVSRGDLTLTLSVRRDGQPDLAVRKNGRVLRRLPAALRTDAEATGLRARKTALMLQAARVRAALESAMITQDSFTPGDFAGLARHPVVAPMLRQLVWTDENGRTLCRDDGQITAADGTAVAVGGPLRIAHPVDLVQDGSWVAWQERLFAEERRQPFKQVFRELYVPTAAERQAGPASHRYDGHQLQPRQALALFSQRGWLGARENGHVARVFHDHDLVVRAGFASGFLTPLEADLPTIDGVYFTRRGEHLAQPLDAIPPVVFSEAMRDLDLIVSIAHAGGVDPEATASTTQMRAALIRETARLLGLANITITGDHVLITGDLGEYSLHLGSGTVHRRPGGAVCIIPAGSQHRGRLFLPFADDDPKTAEIVSKAFLLARDRQIKDPAILEQLRA